MHSSSLMHCSSAKHNDVDFSLCLPLTFLTFYFSFLSLLPLPSNPFCHSPSSHYRWRGKLHRVTGVCGGQRGPSDYPHQRFRHQPKVSVIPSSPPLSLLLSVSSSFPAAEGCLPQGSEKAAVRKVIHKYAHIHTARQLVQLAHIRWVMTCHTGDVIDSSDSWRDAISDPSLPVSCIHPPLLSFLVVPPSPPSISLLAVVITAAGYFPLLRFSVRQAKKKK